MFAAVHTPRGFDAFNIGSGRGTSLNELIATAESVIGKQAIIENLPVPAGDAHFVGVADNNRAWEVLRWNPRTSLKEGLSRTLQATFGRTEATHVPSSEPLSSALTWRMAIRSQDNQGTPSQPEGCAGDTGRSGRVTSSAS